MTHLHHWEPVIENTEAYWQKGSQLGFLIFEGDIESCTCEKMRFVPRDGRLRTVFVEIERRNS